MSVKSLSGGLALASLFISAQPAAAQMASPRFSVSFEVGADVAVTGDVHGGATGTVLALPTRVESRSYGDIYGSPFTWNLGLGFMVGDNDELRVRILRTQGSADRVQVGDVATLPLFGQFDDYKATGVDFGYRRYLGTSETVRPYAGGSVGFLNVDEINGTFTVPAAIVTLPDVPFYESSTVATFSLSGGVLYKLTPQFGLQGNVDFRWHGNLGEVEGLAGTGLQRINDESRRWSMPITFGATIWF